MMRGMVKCDYKVMGIPVYYDERMTNISSFTGLSRWKRIKVGPLFWKLTNREQQAVLLHEAGHCQLDHLQKRILWAWLALVYPKKLMEICHEQEYQADQFAAAAGYRLDLVSFFNKLQEGEVEVDFHPTLQSRIERLMGAQGA